MGSCHTCKSKGNLKQPNHLKNKNKYTYSIDKLNSLIIPIDNPRQRLKFEVRMHNFRAKGLEDSKSYFGEIIFGWDNKENIHYLPITPGSDPKFVMDKIFFFEIEFENLKSTFMDINFYSINHKFSSKDNLNLSEMANKTSPISIMSIDFLSLVIGPEYHDINLIHSSKSNVLGRLSFNINCQQVESIQLEINSLKCKLHHCFQNEISIKLKHFNNNAMYETDYTCPIKGNFNNKKNCTTYKWSQQFDITNRLLINNLISSVHELKSSDLEIYFFETIYEANKDSIILEEYGKPFIDINRGEENNTNVNLKNIIENGIININDYNCINNQSPNPISEEIPIKNEARSKNCAATRKYMKLMTHATITEKFDNHNEKIFEKCEVEDNMAIMLRPHYEEMGRSRVNFYNVLTLHNNLMLKQSTRVFRAFSHLYNNNIFDSKKDFLSLSPKKVMKNYYFGNSCSVEDFKQNQNIKDNNQDDIILEPENKINRSVNEHIKKQGKVNMIQFQIFMDVHKSIFEQEIIKNGKEIGKITGEISIYNIPLIKQMTCGVHTERGLDISSNLLFNQNTFSDYDEVFYLPTEIKEISQLTTEFITKIINNTLSDEMNLSYRELNAFIAANLNNVIKLLSDTKRENFLVFEYKNEIDLIKSQQIILELGLNLLNMLENYSNEVRNLCFRIIELIFEREEFSLSSMTIISGFEKTKEKHLKIKVIEDFFDFLLKNLEYTLEQLSKNVNDTRTKNFIEYFLAVAYFRIPNFHKAFLEAVKKNVIVDSSSLNIPYLNINKISHSSTGSSSLNNLNTFTTDNLRKTTSFEMKLCNDNPIISLLDWQILFYTKLENLKEINLEDKYKYLDHILYNKFNWQDRISRRGMGFYYVISKIEKYIQSKVGAKKNISWGEIPGFPIIIESIVYELKLKKASDYSQPLIDTLKIFLNEYGIINTLYKLIIEKTNVYDTPSVFFVLKILDSLFEHYEKKKDNSDFNYKFDYSLIKKVMTAIFDVDHSIGIAKFIWLYYRNAHLMTIVHVQEIFSEIFKKYFWLLFFHWSWQVRNIFYHLLWFTINHRLKNKNFVTERSKFLKERLEYLNKNDDAGFIKSFNNDYLDQLKSSILKDYYEKMRIIEFIRSIIKKEKLDATYKNEFRDSKFIAEHKINDECRKFIVIGMYHYETVEKFYRGWEKSNKSNKELSKYPDITLVPPKDDIVEYTSHSVEDW